MQYRLVQIGDRKASGHLRHKPCTPSLTEHGRRRRCILKPEWTKRNKRTALPNELEANAVKPPVPTQEQSHSSLSRGRSFSLITS